MTKPLKEELLAWLEKLKQDEQNAPEKYSNCGQLFQLPDGLPIAPELLTKWYRLWRAEHPEFEQIVFHGLRHSSATYQLLQSDGDFKSVQGNTGHATAAVLMETYAHTQDKPRLELTEKIESNFYSQDLTPAASQPRQNESLVRLKFLLFMQRKAGCANLAQKSPRFGQMCKRCAESVQPLSYIIKAALILRSSNSGLPTADSPCGYTAPSGRTALPGCPARPQCHPTAPPPDPHQLRCASGGR